MRQIPHNVRGMKRDVLLPFVILLFLFTLFLFTFANAYASMMTNICSVEYLIIGLAFKSEKCVKT